MDLSDRASINRLPLSLSPLCVRKHQTDFALELSCDCTEIRLKPVDELGLPWDGIRMNDKMQCKAALSVWWKLRKFILKSLRCLSGLANLCLNTGNTGPKSWNGMSVRCIHAHFCAHLHKVLCTRAFWVLCLATVGDHSLHEHKASLLPNESHLSVRSSDPTGQKKSEFMG